MTVMQKLEFGATIFGLIVFFMALGSLFFGWFQFTSTIYISIIIFLMLVFYFFGSDKKIKFGRRQNRKHRKYIKLKWIFILLLIILLTFVLNSGSFNSLKNEVKIAYLTNTNLSSSLNPECEKRLINLIGDNVTFYFTSLRLSMMPVFVNSDERFGDKIVSFSSRFGELADASSNLYYGKNIGEKPNWIYGGGIWSYSYENPSVTNSEGVIIGKNNIEFTLLLEDISKYEDEDLAIKNQLNYQTNRHIRPKKELPWGESSVEFFLKVPLKEVLKVTKCEVVD